MTAGGSSTFGIWYGSTLCLGVHTHAFTFHLVIPLDLAIGEGKKEENGGNWNILEFRVE